MTLLFIIESIVELCLLMTGLYLLQQARQYEADTIQGLRAKVRRLIGLAMSAIILSVILNYGYLVYRYVHPATPNEYVHISKNPIATDIEKPVN